MSPQPPGYALRLDTAALAAENRRLRAVLADIAAAPAYRCDPSLGIVITCEAQRLALAALGSDHAPADIPMESA